MLTGCDLFASPVGVCNLQGEWALKVAVQDSLSGDWVPGAFTIRAVTGGTEEVAEIPDHANVTYAIGLGDQPGTYQVEVDAEGYLSWQKTGIVVTKGECWARTVDVTARLQRP